VSVGSDDAVAGGDVTMTSRDFATRLAGLEGITAAARQSAGAKMRAMLRSFVIALVLFGLVTSSFAQKIVAIIPVGDFPEGVAVNRLANRIYVANEVGQSSSPVVENPNTISVIDGASNQVIGQIVTGLNFQIGLGLDEFRNLIYVATLDSGVGVLDDKTNTVVANIPVANEPVHPGVNPLTKSVYVSTQRDGVAVIDEDENNIIATIPLSGSGEPEDVAVDLFLNRIYVAGTAPINAVGDVWAIDGNTNTVMATIPVSNAATGGIAVNPFTRRAYVTNACSATEPQQCPNTISVIDETTNQIVDTIPVTSGSPAPIAVDELRDVIYTCIETSSGVGVSIINGKNKHLLATVPFPNPGSICAEIAVNPITNRIYCADFGTDTVVVISGPKIQPRRNGKHDSVFAEEADAPFSNSHSE
jgi:YVTN family beta-propeller protein